MGNGMNKVLPGLFLGNFIDAKDFDQLSRHNITHIISIHESPQPYIPVWTPNGTEGQWLRGITYLRIVLPDTPEANIKKHFKKCIHFIHSCRLHGGNCLVHCLAGISRSTTLVLAYIMTVTQASWREALQAVKAVRPVANPNPGFRQQLENYEGSRTEQKIRRRLERKYGENPFNDVEEIGALLTGKRRETFRDEDATQTAMPKSQGATKRTDPFLLRMKETFFCLPGCLK
nr:dual specificity protein phosphatase 15 isoform X2 [Anolis sagrei ordinatus]